MSSPADPPAPDDPFAAPLPSQASEAGASTAAPAALSGLVAGTPPFELRPSPRVRPRDPLAEGPLQALRPWADIFGEMPEPDLKVLGVLMAALSPLIEMAGARLREGRAELDSFDDLIASGPLERLIVSELMWLKLAPTEFARRLAEREALRRRPSYQDPAEDRALAVIVDCGPEMLGRLRLVALAALLCLGAAAHRRGLRFWWRSTGFDQAPHWVEGIARRDLARFTHQTSYAGLGPERLAAALETAPLGAEERLLWTIAPPGAAAALAEAEHTVALCERWEPAGAAAADGSAYRRLGDAVVTGAGGFRRAAAFPFPDEAACAALLRAPFRTPARARAAPPGESWAPQRLCLGSDGAGLCYRLDASDLMLRFNAAHGLRIRLGGEGGEGGAPAAGALLGLRNRPDRVVEVAWRDGADLRLDRISQGGRVESVSTTLAPEHPLMAESHPEDACPPLLRLGRSSRIAVAAPGGALFALRVGDWGVSGGLSVEPAPQLQNHRLLAREGAWLLCQSSGAPGLSAVHARHGRRVALEEDEPLTGPVRGFALISESKGALVATDAGWSWLRRVGAPAQEPPAPELMTGRLLTISAGQDTLKRDTGWSALFWSAEDGLRHLDWRSGEWRARRAPAATIDQRVCAMVKIRSEIFAAVETDDDGPALLQFDYGARGSARKAADERWWREAPCVDL